MNPEKKIYQEPKLQKVKGFDFAIRGNGEFENSNDYQKAEKIMIGDWTNKNEDQHRSVSFSPEITLDLIKRGLIPKDPKVLDIGGVPPWYDKGNPPMMDDPNALIISPGFDLALKLPESKVVSVDVKKIPDEISSLQPDNVIHLADVFPHNNTLPDIRINLTDDNNKEGSPDVIFSEMSIFDPTLSMATLIDETGDRARAQYVYEQLEVARDEAQELLKPGGILIIDNNDNTSPIVPEQLKLIKVYAPNALRKQNDHLKKRLVFVYQKKK